MHKFYHYYPYIPTRLNELDYSTDSSKNTIIMVSYAQDTCYECMIYIYKDVKKWDITFYDKYNSKNPFKYYKRSFNYKNEEDLLSAIFLEVNTYTNTHFNSENAPIVFSIPWKLNKFINNKDCGFKYVYESFISYYKRNGNNLLYLAEIKDLDKKDLNADILYEYAPHLASILLEYYLSMDKYLEYLTKIANETPYN